VQKRREEEKVRGEKQGVRRGLQFVYTDIRVAWAFKNPHRVGKEKHGDGKQKKTDRLEGSLSYNIHE